MGHAAVLCAALLCALGWAAGAPPTVSALPKLLRANLGTAPCLLAFQDQLASLLASRDMGAHWAQVRLSLPAAVAARYALGDLDNLPSWNRDYSAGPGSPVRVCSAFNATFNTRFPVALPPGAAFHAPRLLTYDGSSVIGWSFAVTDAATNATVYSGAHWMGFFDVTEHETGLPATLFITWSKLTGAFVRQHRAAFEQGMSQQVTQADVDGALCLDQVYFTHGQLTRADVAAACSGPRRPLSSITTAKF